MRVIIFKSDCRHSTKGKENKEIVKTLLIWQQIIFLKQKRIILNSK